MATDRTLLSKLRKLAGREALGGFGPLLWRSIFGRARPGSSLESTTGAGARLQPSASYTSEELHVH